jgi:hypothetical protein
MWPQGSRVALEGQDSGVALRVTDGFVDLQMASRAVGGVMGSHGGIGGLQAASGGRS